MFGGPGINVSDNDKGPGDLCSECMSMAINKGQGNRNGFVESGNNDNSWGVPQVPDSDKQHRRQSVRTAEAKNKRHHTQCLKCGQ